MSQTSTERLRDYLAQLPPQAQALLMREFERAIERGEDTTVATFVLEQLRKVVRGTEDDAKRAAPTIRRGCCSDRSSRFSSTATFPPRPGQIRRASLLPVWQWLIRDGAPEPARAFEAALAEIRQSGSNHEPRSGDPQIPARRRRGDLQDRHADGRWRPGSGTLARIGPPNVVEDLLSIGSVLRAREALDTLGSRLPSQLRIFAESQIASVGSRAQRSFAADAAIAAVRAVADHAAADAAVADHPSRDQDGRVRR